jgi:hypothetical protein
LIRGVVFLEDGNFAMGGGIWNNAFLLKVNQQGDTLKSLTLGNGYPESYGVFDIGETSNGILFCGTLSEDQSYHEYSAFYNKCDNLFDNLQENYFDHENEVKYSYSQKILTKNDDTYLVAGTMRTSHSIEDFWIKKIGVLNQIEWERSIGGTKTEILSDVIKSNDGGFLIIGNSDSFDQYTSMYVVKVDSLGLGNYTSPVEEFDVSANDFTVFPNPADSYFVIENSNAFNNFGVLLFDITGKIVFQTQAIEAHTKINTSELASGIYVVKLICNGELSKL